MAMFDSLLTFAERDVVDAKANYERSLRDEMDTLRPLIGGALPAAGVNPKAAEHQLRHRADNQEWVMGAKAVWQEAEARLRTLKTLVGVAPSATSCRIEWRPLDVDPRIEKLLEPARRTAPVELSVNAAKVAEQVGLENAALLPEHVATLESIADAIPGLRGYVLHLDRLPAQVIDTIRPMLERLPRTTELVRFLTLVANGPVNHVV
jgi:hypothetical protein